MQAKNHFRLETIPSLVSSALLSKLSTDYELLMPADARPLQVLKWRSGKFCLAHICSLLKISFAFHGSIAMYSTNAEIMAPFFKSLEPKRDLFRCMINDQPEWTEIISIL